ncbi:MAG TPA: hypothetical protein VGQ41_03945 [Pyrinomonadaceae bacterium]|nr:hypothetical protein [Pyrinomonadaceae bacterium]
MKKQRYGLILIAILVAWTLFALFFLSSDETASLSAVLPQTKKTSTACHPPLPDTKD